VKSGKGACGGGGGGRELLVETARCDDDSACDCGQQSVQLRDEQRTGAGAFVRPPLGLKALQLAVALQVVDGALHSRPEVVGVGVLRGVLLDGERVLVAVQRRAETEHV